MAWFFFFSTPNLPFWSHYLEWAIKRLLLEEYDITHEIRTVDIFIKNLRVEWRQALPIWILLVLARVAVWLYSAALLWETTLSSTRRSITRRRITSSFSQVASRWHPRLTFWPLAGALPIFAPLIPANGGRGVALAAPPSSLSWRRSQKSSGRGTARWGTPVVSWRHSDKDSLWAHAWFARLFCLLACRREGYFRAQSKDRRGLPRCGVRVVVRVSLYLRSKLPCIHNAHLFELCLTIGQFVAVLGVQITTSTLLYLSRFFQVSVRCTFFICIFYIFYLHPTFQNRCPYFLLITFFQSKFVIFFFSTSTDDDPTFFFYFFLFLLVSVCAFIAVYFFFF